MKLVLLAWFFCLSPSLAEVVYIRNQRLPVQHTDGARVVQFDAFKALLTAPEVAAISLDEGRLMATNEQGEMRVYRLSAYGELLEWEELLLWLGYQRRTQPGTGVVDYINAATGEAATVAVWTEPTQAQLALRREASGRRPGYRLAEENFNLVMGQLGEGGTPAELRRIQLLGYRIADQSPLADLHWTFAIGKTPVPNALCTGEGFVVVTEGLLALGLTDDELAGVLGHEIAHGVRRHALIYEERYVEARRMVDELRSLSRSAATAEQEQNNHRLQTIRSRVNVLTPRLEFLADFLKNKQSYDQHEEEEADIQGMQFAAAAGFDPNGEGRALIKLKARSIELFGQSYQEGSRTHPTLKRRLEILSLVQKRWQADRDKASR